MGVNRSGYYKWKWRRSHPSERHVRRMRDVEYIKGQSARHKAHGYRWLAAYVDYYNNERPMYCLGYKTPRQ